MNTLNQNDEDLQLAIQIGDELESRRSVALFLKRKILQHPDDPFYPALLLLKQTIQLDQHTTHVPKTF